MRRTWGKERGGVEIGLPFRLVVIYGGEFSLVEVRPLAK